MKLTTKLSKQGNSFVLTVPAAIKKAFQLEKGDQVEYTIKKILRK